MTATDPQTRLALSRMRLQLTLQQWQSGQKAAAAGGSPDWLNALLLLKPWRWLQAANKPGP